MSVDYISGGWVRNKLSTFVHNYYMYIVLITFHVEHSDDILCCIHICCIQDELKEEHEKELQALKVSRRL